MKFLVLNLKTYSEASGANAVKLAKAAAKAGGSCSVIVCPPQLDLVSAVGIANIVFAQHADSLDAGKSTGSVTVDAVAAAGAQGTLLNHSERKVTFEHAKVVCKKASAAGLKVLLCADSVAEGVKLAALSPWAIAVEPPELIGSGRSVSTENPKIVVEAVKKIKAANPKVLVFVGAGVSTPADCAKCVELGADGVLLSSAFVFSKDPAKFAKECISAMNK